MIYFTHRLWALFEMAHRIIFLYTKGKRRRRCRRNSFISLSFIRDPRVGSGSGSGGGGRRAAGCLRCNFLFEFSCFFFLLFLGAAATRLFHMSYISTAEEKKKELKTLKKKKEETKKAKNKKAKRWRMWRALTTHDARRAS
jgi:hypothetical protein